MLFGGTVEGRELARLCVREGWDCHVYVATDTGEEFLRQLPVTVHVGRLQAEEMTAEFARLEPALVLDATHPYAVEVTKNIQSVCERLSVENIRICRENDTADNYAKFFDDTLAVTEYLNTKNGNIFLTTGSKEAETFTKIKDYQSRCVIRILPCEENIQHCRNLGFENIVAKKPPFSVEENITLIHEYDIQFLVTKDSGKTGGFDSKLQSAKECDIEFLVIRRPQDSGLLLETVKSILWEKYHE